MLKAVIFDFDGVICESVDVKTEAFRKLFQDYPQHLKQIVDFHIMNGGMSRFEKFKVIYRDFLKKDLSEEKSKELGEKFTQYCYSGVLQAPFVKGAEDFLNQYYEKLLLFIVSGTPHEEMISLIKDKALNGFFKAVYGSLMSKYSVVIKIMGQYGLQKDEMVFVGDSMADYDGAKQAGIDFIGRVPRGYPNIFKNKVIEGTINDLSELEQVVKQRM
ncbi:MAG: HAD hydrolase-like protein [Candidatus Omnitrophota bacterium]